LVGDVAKVNRNKKYLQNFDWKTFWKTPNLKMKKVMGG